MPYLTSLSTELLVIPVTVQKSRAPFTRSARLYTLRLNQQALVYSALHSPLNK